ncbi:MAG: hypothetical protein WC699_12955 [Bacteroidales bacterium]
MKNKSARIIILILLVSFFLLLFNYFKLKNTYSGNIKVYIEKIQGVTSSYENYIWYVNSGFHRTINQSMGLNNSKGETISLSQVIEDDFLLIYRVSDLFCSTCNESGLDILNKSADLLSPLKAIVVGTFFDLNYMRKYEELLKEKFPLYSTKSKIGAELEEMGYPYFIMINKKYEIVSFFVPDVLYPEFTRFYLKKLSNR